MAKEIQALLKKGKLTGHEVGQLMIRDLVATFKNSIEGKGETGMLTAAEINTIINGLTTSHDIKRYREFRGVYEYIVNAAKAFVINQGIAEEYLQKIKYIFSGMMHAETENFMSRLRQPRIMTQKQYDDLKREDFEDKMTWTYSPEMLLFRAIQYYIDLYNEDKKTPFDKHFDTAKKQPITNPRIIADYYEDEETDNAETEEARMFNVLENAEGFYASEETDSQETLFEFMEDFPDFYKDLWKKLTAMKGLSCLKNVQKKKYFDDDLIRVKDFYENNILDFREYIEKFIPDGCAGNVAILQPNSIFPNQNIDERGYYKEQEPFWRKHYMAEAILQEKRTTLIKHWIALHRGHLRECLVTTTAFQIIGKFIGVPEISILLDGTDSGINRLIKRGELVNQLIQNAPEHICRYGAFPNERPAEELKAEFEEAFSIVDIKCLIPTEEAIEQARQTINFTIIRDNPEQIYAILKNEASDENIESAIC